MALQNAWGNKPRWLFILIVSSALYLMLLTGLFLTIPVDGVIGNFSGEGLDVHFLLANEDAGIELGDLIVHAGDRSVEAWARRWLSEWPPTSNPWRLGLTVPYTIRRGLVTLTADVSLVRLQPLILARRVFSRLQIYTSLVFLAVGGLLLWKRPREQAAQLWFASSLTLFVVSTATVLVGFQVSLLTQRWIFWLKTADIIFYGLTFSCALHFFLVFPERKRILDRFPVIVPLIYLLFPVITIAGSFLLADNVLDGLFWLRRLAFMMGSLYLVLGGMSLLHSRRTTQRISTRKQINIVLWGTIIGLFPYIFLYGVPLALLGRPLLSPNIPSLVMLVMPAAFALAIARYRLFEIDAILNRGLVYFLLGALLLILFALLFLGLERLQPNWPWFHPLVSAMLVLAAIALFIPLRGRLQHWVDYLLYGSWYDYRTVVMETSLELSRASDLDQLSSGLLAIAENMRFQAAALLWPGDQEYKQKGSFGFTEEELLLMRFPLQGILARQMAAKARPCTRQDALLTLGQTENLSSSEATLVNGQLVHCWLPLVSRESLRGVLALGVRQEALDAQDMDILATVSGQAAVAADNVLLIARLRARLAEVEQVQEELTVAQQRLSESREGERLRLAREVHDGPIQDLQGVRLRLSLLSEDGFSESGAGLDTVQTEILQVIDELRATCQELRPPSLGPFGLEAAMRSFAGRFQETHPELDIQLDLMRDRQMLPERVRLAYFRIFQEALNNVAQHAQASQVQSKLYLDDENVLLEVNDDGAGFQVPRRWTMLARDGHLGLLGSVERAESIGGCLEVISKPGRGTLVRASLPRTVFESNE